ncbi:ADP-ribosylglycohydrolase family protein [Ruania alba]|uniref:ADP-ribosylglycohydrolase n=1 Tax=Ruania alba TaxID=648782 RepID=A0A1H5M6X4_9MICO|nr:ADP-ribosylglycohydrolase family protein [Ruania alba]SEE84903.1 ADP-ribosylglycohydrolase [Ruania alba]
MHDVLDLRDIVSDEVEQLALTGYDTSGLDEEVRAAVGNSDTARLLQLEEALGKLERSPEWAYDEPDDEDSLRALTEHVTRMEVDLDQVRTRLLGAWQGRAVGNTLGKPIEGLTRAETERYLRAAGHWPLRGYLPLLDPLPEGVGELHPSAPVATEGNFTDVPRDDDIDWTMLNLHLLEEHGADLSTDHVAHAWLDRVPFTQTYTAERAAYRNLVHSIGVAETATVRNPYREWIGALIRGDVFGYVHPGDPGAAARAAFTDARLTHRQNGIYGETWAAALCAAALAAEDISEVLRAAAAVVPAHSRLAVVLREVDTLRNSGADATEALDWVDRELGHYPWVHTLNNAALIAIGLTWGESFIDALGITLAGGRDTDSNGATVGSVYGALHGPGSIPEDLIGTTHVHVRSAVRDFDRVSIEELAERTFALVPRR